MTSAPSSTTTLQIAPAEDNDNNTNRKTPCCYCPAVCNWFGRMVSHWSQKIIVPVGLTQLGYGIFRLAVGDWVGGGIHLAGSSGHGLSTGMIAKFRERHAFSESADGFTQGTQQLRETVPELKDASTSLQAACERYKAEAEKWQAKWEETSRKLADAVQTVPALTASVAIVAEAVPAVRENVSALQGVRSAVSEAVSSREAASNNELSSQQDLKRLFEVLQVEIHQHSSNLKQANDGAGNLQQVIETFQSLQRAWEVSQGQRESEAKETSRLDRHVRNLSSVGSTMSAHLAEEQAALDQIRKEEQDLLRIGNENAEKIKRAEELAETLAPLLKLKGIFEKIIGQLPKIKSLSHLEKEQAIETLFSEFSADLVPIQGALKKLN